MGRERKLRKYITVLLLLYISFLVYGYQNFIPDIAYQHVSFNYVLLFLLVILSYIPSVWLPVYTDKPSAFVLWGLYITVVIPSIIIPYLSLEILFYQLLLYDVVLLVCFYFLTRICYLNKIKINYIRLTPTFFYILFFLLYFVLTYSMIQKFGFNFNFIALSDVYSVRAEYRDQLGGDSAVEIRWLLYVFNPFLIVTGYLKKKKWMLAMGFIGEFMIYSTAAFKTALFIGFIIVAILYLSEKFDLIRTLPKLILTGTVILLAIAFIGDTLFFSDDSFSDYNILTSLTLRRNFVVPGFLTGQYLSFFSENPKAYMATHKIIGALVDYQSQYSRPIPYVIGQYTFGKEETSANVNIWADAYGNFGYIGMILTSFVLYIYLLIYDVITANLDLRLSFALMIGPLAFFSNSSLLTALIGHGAIWVLIIIFLYKSSLKISKVSHVKNN